MDSSLSGKKEIHNKVQRGRWKMKIDKKISLNQGFQRDFYPPKCQRPASFQSDDVYKNCKRYKVKNFEISRDLSQKRKKYSQI